jgi:hypothetical protein
VTEEVPSEITKAMSVALDRNLLNARVDAAVTPRFPPPTTRPFSPKHGAAAENGTLDARLFSEFDVRILSGRVRNREDQLDVRG